MKRELHAQFYEGPTVKSVGLLHNSLRFGVRCRGVGSERWNGERPERVSLTNLGTLQTPERRASLQEEDVLMINLSSGLERCSKANLSSQHGQRTRTQLHAAIFAGFGLVVVSLCFTPIMMDSGDERLSIVHSDRINLRSVSFVKTRTPKVQCGVLVDGPVSVSKLEGTL